MRLLFAGALGLLAPGLGHAAGYGTVSSLLMAEGLSVRSLGLSGAWTALAAGEDAPHANPAGLAALRGTALGGGHVLGLLGDRLSYVDLGLALGDAGAIGLNAAYWGGEDTARDAFGNDLGTFSNRQTLAGLTLAKALSPGWSLGLGAKGLIEENGGQSDQSFAGDLGIQGPLGWRRGRFGLAVLNAGQQVSRGAGLPNAPTPLRVALGAAVPFLTPDWHWEADLQSLPYEGQARLLLGSELKMSVNDWQPQSEHGRFNAPAPAQLSLRFGGSFGLLRQEDARLSLGAGIDLPPSTSVDYALQSLGELGLTHRFSVSLRFAAQLLAGSLGAELSAPYGLKVEPQIDGLLLSWDDANERVAGYNLYSDYGVLVERLNSKPIPGRT
jgi:hypothetical protein